MFLNMDNHAIVNRAELTEAFEPPKMKRAPKGATSSIPQTTIIRGVSNILVVEGAFLEKTFHIKGKWKSTIEVNTRETYDLLKKKLPKSDEIAIFINDKGKFVLQVAKLKVSITPVT